MTKPIDIMVGIHVDAPVEESFAYIVPVPLPHIFHRHLFAPGVKRTDESEKWITPGLVRTVYFEDGSTAREELLTVVPSVSFTYRITNFTGFNKLLVAYIYGGWRFASGDNGGTDIAWMYSLTPRGAIAWVIAKLFVAPVMRTFLHNALIIIKHDLEAEEHK